MKYLYFLVCIEILQIVLSVARSLTTMLMGIILTLFNTIGYKEDYATVSLEIPFMLLLMLSTAHLAYIDTIHSTLTQKLLYYLSGGFILFITRYEYQSDVNKLAEKENNYLLRYFSLRFFRITYWIYLVIFLILVFSPFKGSNPITIFSFNAINYVIHIRILGYIITCLGGLLVIGTIKIFIARLIVYFKSNAKLFNLNGKEWFVGYEANQEGNKHFQNKQWQEALECYDKAVARGYKHEVFGNRGICLQEFDYDLDAIDDFSIAIFLNPKDCNLYFLRSISKNKIGDIEGCITDLEEAVKLSELNTELNETYKSISKEWGSTPTFTYKMQLELAKSEVAAEVRYNNSSDEIKKIIGTSRLISTRKQQIHKRR